MLSHEDRQRLIGLARLAVTHFNGGDWQEPGSIPAPFLSLSFPPTVAGTSAAAVRFA